MKMKNTSKNNYKNKKGQIVVYDFIFGFMTFTVIITLATLLWFRADARIGQEADLDIKMKMAHDIASILINTPGVPERWELDNAYGSTENFTVGLAIDHNVISSAKLARFIMLNYTAFGGEGYEGVRKNLFNLGRYNYYMQIKWKNGTIANVTGINPRENISATVTRKVIIDNEIKTLEFTVY